MPELPSDLAAPAAEEAELPATPELPPETAEPAAATPRFEVDHMKDPEWAPDADPAAKPSPFVEPTGDLEFCPVPAPPPDAPVVEATSASTEEQPEPVIDEPAVEELPSSLSPTVEAGELPLPSSEPFDETGDGAATAALNVQSMADMLGVGKDAPAPSEPVAAAPAPGGEPEMEPEEPGITAGSEQPAGPEVTLTEVVDDDDLFEDPNLEVARLEAGQLREIIIPIEIEGDGKAVQRFKLSIRLQLDPLR
jgi:hypothetical protein